MPLANPTLKTGITESLLRDEQMSGARKNIVRLGTINEKDGANPTFVVYDQDANVVIVLNG